VTLFFEQHSLQMFFHCIYYKKHWFLLFFPRENILVFKPNSLNLQQINTEREGHSVFKLNKCQQVCPTKIIAILQKQSHLFIWVQVKTLFKAVFNNNIPPCSHFNSSLLIMTQNSDLMTCQKTKKTPSFSHAAMC